MNEKHLRKIFVILFILFLSLLLNPDQGRADEDRVFFSPNSSNTNEETHSCYVGESSLEMTVIFGQNVTSWSIYIPTSLFTNNLGAIRSEPQRKGVSGSQHLPINQSAPVGDYNLTLFLNYTTESQENVSKTFNYPMHFKKSLKIKKITKPHFFGKTFSIEVQTFTTFSELTVFFDSDGDVDVEPESLVFHNLKPGNLTFKTKVKKGISFAGDRQELSYDIRGTTDNHKIRISEYNIAVSISVEEIKDSNVCLSLTALLIICIILVVVMFNHRCSIRAQSCQKQKDEKCGKRETKQEIVKIEESVKTEETH